MLIVLFTLSVIPSALILDWYFQGKENLIPLSLGKLLLSATYLILLLIILQSSEEIIWVPISFLIANFIGAFLMLVWYLSKYGSFKLSFKVREWLKIFKESSAISFSSILVQINVNLPIIIIGIILTTEDAGVFSAASKLVFFLLILDRIFYSVYFPAVTRIYSQNKDRLSEIIGFVSKLTIIFLLPLTIAIGLLAEPIINVIFGSKYLGAVELFQIFIWYFFLTILNSIFGFGLIAINQEKIYAKVVSISFVLYLLFTIILTYLFGLKGTVSAIVLIELLVFIMFRYYFKKFVDVEIIKYILKAIPSLIVMSTVIFFTSAGSTIIAIVMGLLAYIVILFITGGLTKSDLKLVKEKFLWS